MPMQQDKQNHQCKTQLEEKTCHQAMSEVGNLGLILGQMWCHRQQDLRLLILIRL